MGKRDKFIEKEKNIIERRLNMYIDKTENGTRRIFTQGDVLLYMDNYILPYHNGDLIKLDNIYCNEYMVIDKNHDNTKNTIDIISTRQVYNMEFGNSGEYASSNVREWLNTTYLKAFTSTKIRKLFKAMEVKCNTNDKIGYIVNDKVKIPSIIELNYKEKDYNTEGDAYDIFTKDNIWVDKGIYGNDNSYWLRTSNDNVANYGNFIVTSKGTISDKSAPYIRHGVLPILRLSYK
jgi:hypothetical protein